LYIIFSYYQLASAIAFVIRHRLIQRLRCTFNEK